MKSAQKEAGIDKQSNSDVTHKLFSGVHVNALQKANLASTVGWVDWESHNGCGDWEDGDFNFGLVGLTIYLFVGD
jgi:hypothetical protein